MIKDLHCMLRKQVMNMPMTEKELNCILLDQLSLLEDIEEVVKTKSSKETLELIAKKRKQIERKLYQQPPVSDNN